MTEQPAATEDLIGRLQGVNPEAPVIDRHRVEQAIGRHLAALGLTHVSVRWATDGEQGFRAVRDFDANAAWLAALDQTKQRLDSLLHHDNRAAILDRTRERLWTDADRATRSHAQARAGQAPQPKGWVAPRTPTASMLLRTVGPASI